MAGIVLSSSVRQNLLSLQSTADLLATTQNRLATGKKVNTALDNPTNFFTAQSLDSRAGDINNLLDGIGNGVQVLQAANTGITSLQKLVDTAKSIANQALQTTVGYSTKSTSLRRDRRRHGRQSAYHANQATATSNVLFSGTVGHLRSRCGTTLGGTSAALVGTAAATVPARASPLRPCLSASPPPLRPTLADRRRRLTVNGKTITFEVGLGPGGMASAGSGPAAISSPTAMATHRLPRRLDRHADRHVRIWQRHRPRQRRQKPSTPTARRRLQPSGTIRAIAAVVA